MARTYAHVLLGVLMIASAAHALQTGSLRPPQQQHGQHTPGSRRRTPATARRPRHALSVSKAAAANKWAPGPSSSTLRIVANMKPQRQKQPYLSDREWSSYSNAVHFDRLNLNVEPIVALACLEWKDWMERTIDRNVKGHRFQFDTHQWSTSFGKWWARALEADEQARIDFSRQYHRLLALRRQQRIAAAGSSSAASAVRSSSSSSAASMSSFEAEEDWEHIYFECTADPQMREELANGARFATVPVSQEAHTAEIIDCAVNGRWRYTYNESGAQVVDYQPW